MKYFNFGLRPDTAQTYTDREMTTLETIRAQIKTYNDFPKKGILFYDLLPLLGNAETFTALIGEINDRISSPNVAAPEARGFLFASPLLTIPGGVKSLIAFRKGGKLPAEDKDLVKIPVIKEYGDDSLYFRISDVAAAHPTLGIKPVIEITLFDDVLATGGTAEGMARQLNELVVDTLHGKIPVRVREFVFLTELADLGARSRLECIAPVTSLIVL